MPIRSLYVIPNTEQLLNRYERKCSFCGCKTHNVSRCNSEVINSFNNYLKYLKNYYMSFYSNVMLLAIQNFENYLYDYCNESEDNKKILRTVACRYYKIRLRSLLQISINNIIMQLFDINVSWFSNNQYNLISFTQYSPMRISVVLNQITLNYITSNNINIINEPVIEEYVHYEIKLEELSNSNNNNTNNDISIIIECPICYNNVDKTNIITLNCKHDFCLDCSQKLLNTKHKNCPYCRNDIQTITCYKKDVYDKYLLNKLLI